MKLEQARKQGLVKDARFQRPEGWRITFFRNSTVWVHPSVLLEGEITREEKAAGQHPSILIFQGWPDDTIEQKAKRKALASLYCKMDAAINEFHRFHGGNIWSPRLNYLNRVKTAIEQELLKCQMIEGKWQPVIPTCLK
jgi:hypothetical protein